MCYACNPHLIPESVDVNNSLLFCGGEPICTCEAPNGWDDMTDSEKWVWLNGYEDALLNLPEMPA